MTVLIPLVYKYTTSGHIRDVVICRGTKMRDRKSYPQWVKIGLWGLPTRVLASTCMWLSIAITIACFISGNFFLGLTIALAALWYWSAINWVDKNDRW
jgi:hypothetical protein